MHTITLNFETKEALDDFKEVVYMAIWNSKDVRKAGAFIDFSNGAGPLARIPKIQSK